MCAIGSTVFCCYDWFATFYFQSITSQSVIENYNCCNFTYQIQLQHITDIYLCLMFAHFNNTYCANPICIPLFAISVTSLPNMYFSNYEWYMIQIWNWSSNCTFNKNFTRTTSITVIDNLSYKFAKFKTILTSIFKQNEI